MASDISSSSKNSPSSVQLSNNFSHVVSVKLSSENYLLWRAQIIPYLHGQELFHFVDGSTPPPSPFKSVSPSPSTSPLPQTSLEYLQWRRTDQLLLSTLLSSLTESILAQVISSRTSRDLWVTLEGMFTSQSQAKIFQIRHQLTNLKKGSLSVADYYHKVRLLSDTMTAAGEPLRDSEVVSYLLNGLNSEFDSFVISITTRATPISSTELFNHLLTLESRISLHSNQQGILPNPSANFTTPSFSRGGRNQFRGGKNNGRNGRNRGGRSFNSYQNSSQPSFKPTCQVCNKVGHVALQCLHRFDQAYQHGPPRSFSAHYTTSQSPSDQTWYPDSAATNHLTSDLNNLNINADHYPGPEQIRVGDGSSLPITHIGQTNGESSTSRSNT
ncbi:hypothetical protein F2P56_026649 [Juglans regia]|uniref:Retrotransposon Copia-like N-terminal domain-containing protein n=1 Tax=Juglans regia TaxID=51240 RepID=A0A833U234_JUGRE|nr:hypothetical protein F2P56_026649 [Juglans regia]